MNPDKIGDIVLALLSVFTYVFGRRHGYKKATRVNSKNSFRGDSEGSQD